MSFNVIEVQENIIAQNIMSKRAVISKEDRAAAEKYIQSVTDRFSLSGYNGQYDMWWARNEGQPVNCLFYIE